MAQTEGSNFIAAAKSLLVASDDMSSFIGYNGDIVSTTWPDGTLLNVSMPRVFIFDGQCTSEVESGSSFQATCSQGSLNVFVFVLVPSTS